MTITIPPGLPPTDNQREYVDAIKRRLHLADYLLDNHCVAKFGKKRADLDRAETSALIDEMLSWPGIPAEVRREAGQVDLPGFGAV